MSETTKKEQEFVIKIFEVVQEYEDADFDIIGSISTIFKILFFAKKRKISIAKVIKDNKKKWGISE